MQGPEKEPTVWRNKTFNVMSLTALPAQLAVLFLQWIPAKARIWAEIFRWEGGEGRRSRIKIPKVLGSLEKHIQNDYCFDFILASSSS